MVRIQAQRNDLWLGNSENRLSGRNGVSDDIGKISVSGKVFSDRSAGQISQVALSRNVSPQHIIPVVCLSIGLFNQGSPKFSLVVGKRLST